MSNMVEEMQGFHDNQARAFAEQAATITALRDRVAEVERQLAQATDPEYLAGALEKIGVCDIAHATAAEAAIARLRDEVIEECAKWHDAQHAKLADKPVWQSLSAHPDYAAALRALKDTHHETR